MPHDLEYRQDTRPTVRRDSFVPAVPDRTRPPLEDAARAHAEAIERAAAVAPIVPINAAAALAVVDGAIEKTSGKDRAVGLSIRLGLWAAISGGFGLIVGLTHGGVWGLLVLFAGTGLAYVVLAAQDYRYSRNGLERHKVDVVVSLKRDEMRHAQELRRMALESNLALLEKLYRDD